jgi:uncharacterized membrane protein
MDENDEQAQARAVVGLGLSRELGQSRARVAAADQRRGNFKFELSPRRSLGTTGFTVLMVAVLAINLAVGTAFSIIGAWPVLGFCGLDVVLIYWAFRSNYRSGRAAETLELTPLELTLVRTHPSGTRESFTFNPYWVRVRLDEQRDGRNQLRLASHGRDFLFAGFLSDDERRDFAVNLTNALLTVRSVRSV